MKDTRPDIPFGYTRDENGRELTFKDSDGYWWEYTRDENGRVIIFKNSDGYWREYTRDENGRVITFKDSDGYWREYTRDENGRELTYKTEGFFGHRIDYGGLYTLFYDPERKLFVAGCRGPFTKEQALKHWERRDPRAILFTKAIKEVDA